MSKSNETKIAEKLTDSLNDGTFSPAVMANYIVTHNPTYTLDRVMELVKYIIQYSSIKMRSEWDKGYTSEGLMLADALNDLLEAKYGAVEVDTTSLEEKRIRDPKYIMDLDSF
jgi:hypothetical protein